ncbi:sensor histidine kinase [Cytophagales bacterium LB-30]|uniref:histidine kinase n=1 Tax=Shiella aurantiaca TaxID=3058365 RepID=A0ABT8F0P2_9BACT|nr:sensor histidine kinase [Shiella aurantiaca]MDN4164005.1 sensor histidine kinase [Shiella aurantiaca]
MLTYRARLISLLFLSLALFHYGLASDLPLVKKGYYELRSEYLNQHASLDLRGEWRFVWLNGKTTASSFQKVPESWHSYDSVPGIPYPVEGRALFEITVDNPERIKNLTLLLFGISTSYKVWINHQMVEANGIFAPNGHAVRSRSIIDLPNGASEYLIQIEVDNHEHAFSGINQTPIIARSSFMHSKEKFRLYVELIQMGALLIMLLYHVILFWQMRQASHILMSILCLMVLVRSSVVYDGSLILYELFPQLDFVLAKKLEYGAVYLAVFVPLSFVNQLFYDKRFVIIERLLQAITAILLALVIFTPPQVFGHTLDFYHVMQIICFIFMFWVLGQAIYRRRRGAITVTLGVVICVVFVVIEILRNSGYREVSNFGANFVDTGVVLYLFFQTIAISNIFTKAYNDNRLLTRSLEKRVQERTEQLSSANVVKERLISILSHDLKSPLNSLQGYLQVLASGKFTQEEQTKVASKIQHSLAQTNEMLNTLLEWSSGQIAGNKDWLAKEDFNLYVLTEESIGEVQTFAAEKQINMLNNLPSECLVSADRNMMRVVLRNLLHNAIKFTPSQGKVSVGATEHMEYWEIHVTDTGVGIPDDLLVSLFELRKKSREGTNQEKGTGIGLMLCQDLVQQNGGKIWVRPNPEGNGTQFVFTVLKVQSL